jgi:hypothetical protein
VTWLAAVQTTRSKTGNSPKNNVLGRQKSPILGRAIRVLITLTDTSAQLTKTREVFKVFALGGFFIPLCFWAVLGGIHGADEIIRPVFALVTDDPIIASVFAEYILDPLVVGRVLATPPAV